MKKYIRTVIVALGFSAILSSCVDKDDNASERRTSVVFAATHSIWGNSGAIVSQTGYFIDENRGIYWFSNASAAPIDFSRSYTSSELARAFPENASFLRYLSSSEFDALLSHAQQSIDGELSIPENICSFAGLFHYTYFHPTNSNSYRPVLIYQTGDWRRLNTDTSAEAVRAALIELAVEFHLATITPGSDSRCTGA